MGGVAKSISKGVSNIAKPVQSVIRGDLKGAFNSAVNNPLFNPVGAGIKGLTGISPTVQLGIGAGIGTGVAALGALGAGGAAGAAGSTGAATAGVGGTTAALGPGGAGVMAQSGGIPLLTKVLLGTSVASTLAGYFGVGKSDQDYSSWFQGLSQEDQAQVKALEDNLTSLQGDLDKRNQAVQQVLNDYPNVMAQVAKDRAASGQEFDDVTKGYMEQALNQTAAKYAANGGLSSGAMNEATAQTGANLALQKLGYMGDREQSSYQQNMAGYTARLNEAEALRQFQQKMLGTGVDQRFSAAQNALQRQAGFQTAGAEMQQKQDLYNDEQKSKLFGSLGQTLGTAAMLPLYQQMWNRPMQVAGSGAPQVNGQTGLATPKLTNYNGGNA